MISPIPRGGGIASKWKNNRNWTRNCKWKNIRQCGRVAEKHPEKQPETQPEKQPELDTELQVEKQLEFGLCGRGFRIIVTRHRNVPARRKNKR